jgi:hypothetical protein
MSGNFKMILEIISIVTMAIVIIVLFRPHRDYGLTPKEEEGM